MGSDALTAGRRLQPAKSDGDAAILNRLARIDCCALSDALDRLGLPPAVSGLPPRSVHRRIFGRVLTVKLTAGASPPSREAKHLGVIGIETATPGSVIVVEQTTGIDAAGWGGVLSSAALVRGVRGAIVDGPARDLDEAAMIGFPVYARAVTARTARGRIHEATTGEAVIIGGTRVLSGDYVVADSSGVAFVPAGEIVRMLDAAETIGRREALMTKALLAGQTASAVLGQDYETMLEK